MGGLGGSFIGGGFGGGGAPGGGSDSHGLGPRGGGNPDGFGGNGGEPGDGWPNDGAPDQLADNRDFPPGNFPPHGPQDGWHGDPPGWHDGPADGAPDYPGSDGPTQFFADPLTDLGDAPSDLTDLDDPIDMPEPSSLALVAAALLGLGAIARKRKHRASV